LSGRKLFQLKSYLTYWLDAADEHSLHSPFLFEFYTKVVKAQPSVTLPSFPDIRNRLLNDKRKIQVTDLGAGSNHLHHNHRKVSDICRYTTSSHKFSSLYARIIEYHKFKHVIELGTSVGINAMYLAKAFDSVDVTTFEGSPEIAALARGLFKDYGFTSIKVVEGNIDSTLKAYLSTVNELDFALVDANHRFEPTLNYIELLMKKIHAHSVIAVDDIHSSPEMERAWQAIQNHERIRTTIDLYRCGLIFFNPSLTKQNVVLQY
jgi:predicted O-methyltransferase YrrM